MVSQVVSRRNLLSGVVVVIGMLGAGASWAAAQADTEPAPRPAAQSEVQSPPENPRKRLPIPDKLVVLTFDDSCQSHATFVAPLLKQYGFRATFFVTEGFDFPTNKIDYMTWEQIAGLHKAGFEIGNHTRDHLAVQPRTLNQLDEQLEGIERRCREHGIPRPVSFAWPGNAFTPQAIPILRRHGIRFARRGGEPEVAYKVGGGFAYEPGLDHPLLIPSAGDGRPTWKMDDFVQAVSKAKQGRVAVLQFHGVPDTAHDWVSTSAQNFEAFMKYLHVNKFTVIAVRDLERYADWRSEPKDVYAVMERRKRELQAAPVKN